MRKFQSSLYEGSEFDNHNDNHNDNAFSIHKLWLLSGGGGVSGRHRKDFLTAHNWWSVEYETAAVLLNSNGTRPTSKWQNQKEVTRLENQTSYLLPISSRTQL